MSEKSGFLKSPDLNESSYQTLVFKFFGINPAN